MDERHQKRTSRWRCPFLLERHSAFENCYLPVTILFVIDHPAGSDLENEFCKRTGSLIHLLGTASHVVGDSANFKAELKLWPKDKTDVLVSGIPQKPLSVTWQGKAIPFEWYPEHQALVLKLVGKGTLKVN